MRTRALTDGSRRRADIRAIMLALSVLVLLATVVAAQGDEGVAMREKVYEKLSRAQEAAEKGDYERAVDLLESVERMRDLEPYELAQLYTAYGYIYFTQEQYAESIVAYEKVMQQDELPDALAATTLYTLAQLYFQQGDYQSAAARLERWLVTTPHPGPEAYVLLGQAYIQLDRHRDAIEPIEQAIAVAAERDQPAETNWYLLLRAVYHELGDYPKLVEVLDELLSRAPRGEYWIHLAAAYGEMGDDIRQLAAYEVAFEQGSLNTGREHVLLAQLYLQAEVPYRAARILSQGLESGLIEGTVGNYRLLSQAWTLAQENEQAIEALTLAAALTDDGELDARLAVSHANLGDWERAVSSARTALDRGVEDAHDVQMTLGMALFELGRNEEAKDAFRAAQRSPAGRETATRWLSYIEREEMRESELRRTLR